LNLDTYRESKRNQFPDLEFFELMKTYINKLEFDEKKTLLSPFGYSHVQSVIAHQKGVEHVTGKHDFNALAWSLYDNKIIDHEILHSDDVKNFNEWESMPDFKDCIVCGDSFDYRPTRENRHRQNRCSDHLIQSMNELKQEPKATLGDLTEELQKQYWSIIVDDTLGELSKAGVVKKE
jgi:hypothetical protein